MRKILLTCVFIALSSVLNGGDEKEQKEERTTVRFFLGEVGDISSPLPGVFVYLAPTDHLYDSELIAWLQKNARPPASKVHHFSIKDGQLTPRKSIVFVDDSIHTGSDANFHLSVEPFLNTARGGIDPWYEFFCSERFPIDVKVVLPENTKKAEVLVTDHTINGISDENGLVEFASLPKQKNLTFFIRSFPDDAEKRYQYSSPTATIERMQRLCLDTPVANQEHIVFVKVIPK
jgi:hypothetical protein